MTFKAAIEDTRWPCGAISGIWHLLHGASDESNIPDHRMDLRFEHDQVQLRAAVLLRDSGEEMLMIHRASFDGNVLELQLVAPPGKNQVEMPTLVMNVNGPRLLGHWQLEGEPMGPGLKLVRARGV